MECRTFVSSGPTSLPMINHVRRARLERNWSQGLLAQKTGVARQTINSIENGRSVPSLELAFKLGLVLEKNIEELFTFSSDPPAPLPALGIRVDASPLSG